MTRYYRYQKRVGDLKLGDFFIGWVLKGDEAAQPRRILDIKDSPAARTIVLDDGKRYTFHPEHLTIVQGRA